MRLFFYWKGSEQHYVCTQGCLRPVYKPHSVQ